MDNEIDSYEDDSFEPRDLFAIFGEIITGREISVSEETPTFIKFRFAIRLNESVEQLAEEMRNEATKSEKVDIMHDTIRIYGEDYGPVAPDIGSHEIRRFDGHGTHDYLVCEINFGDVTDTDSNPTMPDMSQW